MSALAAAKKRRAGIASFTPELNAKSTTQPSSDSSGAGGLTLQQVISVIDKRLVVLENHMNESKNMELYKSENINQQLPVESSESLSTSTHEMIEEFHNRTVMLADEISVIKDIVLKLQAYTMEVN